MKHIEEVIKIFFFSTAVIKDYSAKTDGKNFFDERNKSYIKAYEYV